MKYAVLDSFFNSQALDAYFESHRQFDFKEDDLGKPYDSNTIFGSAEMPGGELFFHKPWHRFVSSLLGTELQKLESRTVVKARQHDGDSKGFWIHTDRSKSNPARQGVLTYLNRDWQPSYGGLLQLWQPMRVDSAGRVSIVGANFTDMLFSLAGKSIEEANAQPEHMHLQNVNSKVDHPFSQCHERLDFLTEKKVLSAHIPPRSGWKRIKFLWSTRSSRSTIVWS